MKIRLSNEDWEHLESKMESVDKPNLTYVSFFILFCLSACLFMITFHLLKNDFLASKVKGNLIEHK